MAPNSVDFPAPFAPMIVMKSPSGTLSDNSCSAGIEGLGDFLQFQHLSQPAFLCILRRRTGSRVLRYGIEIASTTMTADTSFSINAGISSRSATV